jgi:hypothetical protein
MKSILAFILPRVRRLFIQASNQGTQSEFSMVKSILDQCSTTLESLDVDINALRVYKADDKDESICWTSLKDLTLRHDRGSWDAGPVWSWMCRRCSQVERLYVRMIDQSTPSLVQAMLAYMHNLREITVGDHSQRTFYGYPDDEMKDDVIAALLSGSRRGWKGVSVRATAKLGRATMNALAMHYSTLQEFYIDGHPDHLSSDLVQVLRSCPHLHTLRYTHWRSGISAVDSEVFADMDPITGSLKPWLCEGSLKMLEIKIARIPRPDLKKDDVDEEAYPGQGREIQSQVYGRLGRLTHLEKLRLSDVTSTPRSDCLEMTLESGLDKLSGLKSLQELNVGSMETNIGTKEIQWMVENWPKLGVIHGVNGRAKDWRR